MRDNLPRIDLHRHLDGSVRLQTILDIGLKHNLSLPATSLASLKNFIQITDTQPGVMAFIQRLDWMRRILIDQAACYRVAYECVEDAAKEDMDYVEFRFSPWFMAEPHLLLPEQVVEAVIDGAEHASQDYGLKINLIGIISRTYGPKIGLNELNAILSFRDHFVAADLAGDEAGFPGDLFTEHFKLAQERGLHITIHAGESAGPASIWQAIRGLKAERIGHALSALEDPNLIEFIVEHEIGIECNLTSNIQTSSVSDYSCHPIKALLETGVLATINTDDPGVSDITYDHEINIAAKKAGLSEKLIQCARNNSLQTAFLSPTERVELVNKIRERYSDYAK